MKFVVNNVDPPEGVTDFELLQIYNGLDNQATLEIEEILQPQLDETIIDDGKILAPPPRLVYNFERAQLAPAIDMMFRGLLIDKEFRFKEARKALYKAQAAERVWDQICYEILDRTFNINSPMVVGQLFYDHLYLPEQKDRKTGSRTTNIEVLDVLELYPHAFYLIKCLKIYRAQMKLLQVLQTGIDEDDRIRTSYNVGATETGRWSSSESVFGTGDNLQNKTKSVRVMFVADQGYKMFQVDLRQAESRGVGYLSGDEGYIAACEGGDLHTDVARMVYTDIEWPNDPASQRALADEKFYRHFGRRDLTKRGGHGSNYYGTARTVAKAMQVPLDAGEEFQLNYFTAFPKIRAWHRHKAEELGKQGFSVTPLGRRRHFLGRRNSDETLREAIANDPQSLIVDIVDIALLRLFMNSYPLLLLQTQTHDSITGLFLEKDEAEAVAAIEKAFEIDVPVYGADKIMRTMRIPTEIQTGWNLGEWDKKNPDKNPDGLKEYKGGDERQRTRPAEISVMDWRFRRDDRPT